MSQTLRDESKPVKLRFGKYRDCDIQTVPSEYLEYLLAASEKSISEIRTELERRQLVEEADLDLIDRIVAVGYRELAKKYHPDYGGDEETMKELNAAAEFLRDAIR